MSDSEYETPVMYVRCTECGDCHVAGEVTVENVEEDFLGRDVVTFQCPVTNHLARSLVYNGFPRA